MNDVLAVTGGFGNSRTWGAALGICGGSLSLTRGRQVEDVPRPFVTRCVDEALAVAAKTLESRNVDTAETMTQTPVQVSELRCRAAVAAVAVWLMSAAWEGAATERPLMTSGVTTPLLPQGVELGRRLFEATWTVSGGGRRPNTKGTGRPIVGRLPSGPNGPWNRVSAPDAGSCAACHNLPYGHVGGGGDFVTGVFVLGQRFDYMTFDPADSVPLRGTVEEDGTVVTLQDAGDFRATTGMFGAGYLEMVARQMTADLQRIRDSIARGQTKELVAKGVHFGSLTLKNDGLWDTSRVEGLGRLSLISNGTVSPPTLIVRPWHQSSNVVSLREFTNTAFNQHHGIQTVERFGLDADPDGDGVKNEMSVDDVTTVTLFQATLPVPGRVIPSDPIVERAVLKGEQLFADVGCNSCHVPKLPLDQQGWVFVEPNPYNPPGNLRSGERPDVRMDLSDETLPQPRLTPDKSGVVWVDAYTDFKLHDICGPDGPREPLDQNAAQWTPRIRDGNCRFLTKRLWGAANEPPFFHHGLFTTLRRSILAHDGEARDSRRAFEALPAADRDALIEFLKTLQVLPPGTKDRIVDEQFKPRSWPPANTTTPSQTTAEWRSR